MLSEAKRPATAQRRRTLFLEAADIIQEEYDLPIALDDVARRVATSRRQLQRAFAEAGETSFRAYVQRVRMERAADLLSKTPTPVNAVASAVGYRQAAQFAKAFRRHHGAPPSSFRAAALAASAKGSRAAQRGTPPAAKTGTPAAARAEAALAA
jgi:AraC family transcriptional regulator, regulatory protein of adaptative response / methylphosphotriester-DNA alkyltransferase methyltransferase